MRIAICVLGMMSLALATPCVAKESRDEAAIRAGSDAFLAAYNDGDVDAVVKHFAATATVMPPNMGSLHGRDEIRQFVQKGIAGAKANGITLALAAGSDVGVSGDLGFHSGTYTASKAGAAIDNGKYLETWRKSGGEWRMMRRMWNSDRPAAK